MPWYYYRGGIRKGPIDDPAFRQMAAAGELEPTDVVWSPGMKEWVQAATVPGLLAPPPLPPQGHPTPEDVFLEGQSARAIQATKPVPEVAKPRQPQALPVPQTRPGVTARPRGNSAFAVASPHGTEKKSPIGWYVEALKKYAVFSGRARRREFWWFFLINAAVDWLFGLLAGVTRGFFLLLGVWTLAVLLPGIAVSSRRLHDVGKSGWLQFLPLGVILSVVPLFRVFGKDVGNSLMPLWVVLCLAVCMYYFWLVTADSKPGANQYGPNPKGINAA
jgi:uncharacterized membrane protein YhaH (DUF805 family)